MVGSMDRKMEKQGRSLIEEIRVIPRKLAADESDENAIGISRDLNKKAIRLQSLLSAIEYVQKQ
jgi:hypothetical protein